jgi:hypothetical protein
VLIYCESRDTLWTSRASPRYTRSIAAPRATHGNSPSCSFWSRRSHYPPTLHLHVYPFLKRVVVRNLQDVVVYATRDVRLTYTELTYLQRSPPRKSSDRRSAYVRRRWLS